MTPVYVLILWTAIRPMWRKLLKGFWDLRMYCTSFSGRSLSRPTYFWSTKDKCHCCFRFCFSSKICGVLPSSIFFGRPDYYLYVLLGQRKNFFLTRLPLSLMKTIGRYLSQWFLSTVLLKNSLTRGVGKAGKQTSKQIALPMGGQWKIVGSKRKNEMLLTDFQQHLKSRWRVLFQCFWNCVVMTIWFCVSVWFCFRSVFDFTGRGLNMKANLLDVSMATYKAKLPVLFFSLLPFRPVT